jgi:hypothetical protein
MVFTSCNDYALWRAESQFLKRAVTSHYRRDVRHLQSLVTILRQKLPLFDRFKDESFFLRASVKEGQKVYGQASETPAHPKVEPLEKVRPDKPYMLSVGDVKEFPRYEKTWKEIFQIR